MTALPRAPPRLPPGSLIAAHSQTTAFEPPGRPRQAPGITPEAAVLPGLVAVINRPVTLLGPVTGRSTLVCAGLPPCHSFRKPSGLRFPPTKTEARGTQESRFSRFGTVSDRHNWQGLSPLSWLSFSQPPDLPAVPGLVTSELVGRPTQCSPRKPRLNGHRTKSLSPNPLDGIVVCQRIGCNT